MENKKFMELAINKRLSIKAFTVVVFLIEEHNGKIHLPTIDYDDSFNGRFRSIFECNKSDFKEGVQELIDSHFLLEDDSGMNFYLLDENKF